MDKSYWLSRKRSALAMARGASTAQARLIHYDLAGRYSIRAAMCVPLPYMLPPTAPSGEGERAALDIPLPPPGPLGPNGAGKPDQETRR